MRVFVLSLFIGVALSAPQQGYKYQVNIGPNDGSNSNDFTLEQYQLLQQFANQQQLGQQQQFSPLQLQQQQQQQYQQPALQQIIAIKEPSTTAEVATISQTVTQAADKSGYQFGTNQLVQAQKLVQYESQAQPKLPEKQQQVEQQIQIDDAPVIDFHASLQVPQGGEELQSLQAQPQHHHEEQHIVQVTEAPVPVVVEVRLRQPQPQSQSQVPAQYASLPQQSIPEQPFTQSHQSTHYHQPAHEPYHHNSVQYNKEFYYLSAPQEDYDQSQDFQNQLNNMKKNLRVVFIKAPEQNDISKATLQLAQQANSQQTAIYVLTKQHDVGELVKKLQQVRGSSHANPDVSFIKYKTPEEAEHAQRTIQAQYEALDGPNHFNHDGVVPSHNFVGSTTVGHVGGIDPRRSPSADADSAAVSLASKYLPADAKH